MAMQIILLFVFIFNGEEVARMDFTIMIEYNLVTDNIG
jgi:hypothetical protein